MAGRPGHDGAGRCGIEREDTSAGRSHWSSEKKLVAERLRKTEFVLYFSYSRTLTSTLLQPGEPEDKESKIDFEAFRPQPETRVTVRENFSYLDRCNPLKSLDL
jgi:hypothetical protein